MKALSYRRVRRSLIGARRQHAYSEFPADGHTTETSFMNQTRISFIRIACVVAALGSSTWAQAEMNKSVFNSAQKDIKATYKAERDGCSSLSANAKDICVQTAKGREKVALAHLQMQRTGTEKDATKLAQARYEARYEVAKEKCDDLSGNAKDVCAQQAKTERDKVKADVTMKKEVREARTEADEAKMKADYKLASERCDSQTGQAKDACTAAAKARFGM